MNRFNYIQYAEGYSKENISIEDVDKALNALKQWNDEHGFFWVSVVNEEETVLETNKELKVIAVFEDNPDKRFQIVCNDFQEIQNLYLLLLSGNFEELKQHFNR